MKGFVFTLEAFLALLSLVSVLLLLQVPYEDYSTVVLYKQTSDIANRLVHTRNLTESEALAHQADLRIRVTACNKIVFDQSPSNPIRVQTLYYDKTYCELVVEASRQ